MLSRNVALNWIPNTDGTLTAEGQCRSFALKPFGTGATLWASTPKVPNNLVWASADPQECRDMADLIQAHDFGEARWAAEAPRTTEVQTKSGRVSISVTRTLGHFDAVLSIAGQEIGKFEGHYNDWRARWVLGEPTVSGLLSLNQTDVGDVEELVGRLYDAIEEATDLPVAPEGRLGAWGPAMISMGAIKHGFPLAMSDSFWQARAAARPVPGINDPAALSRSKALFDFCRFMAQLELDYRDCRFAAALSEATGLRIQGLFGDPSRSFGDFGMPLGEPGHQLLHAWCVDEQGNPVTTVPVTMERLTAYVGSPALRLISAEEIMALEQDRYSRIFADNLEIDPAERFNGDMDEKRAFVAKLLEMTGWQAVAPGSAVEDDLDAEDEDMDAGAEP